MPGSSLLDRQVEKSRLPDGSIDYTKLKRLVVAAYNDKENDRRRADRASRLVTVELEQAARELEVQNLRFKAALDNMSQGLSLFDREGNLVVCNRRFAEILELPRNPCCIGARIDRILDNQRRPSRAPTTWIGACYARSWSSPIAGRAPGVEQTWPDGRHISLVRTPVADGGFLDTITDITETRAAAARLTPHGASRRPHRPAEPRHAARSAGRDDRDRIGRLHSRDPLS
jgi:PAS domain-containing protein